MFWSNFLHFYQPPNQQKDILERIVNESYRPLMKGIKENPQALATININGGLLELLSENGYDDVINDLRELLRRGQIELTGSAKYHAFLPLLPESEVRRQIEINEESLREYFADAWIKRGFFPPELVYDLNLAKIISEMGYGWMVAAEIAFGSEKPAPDKMYKIKGLNDFTIFFRNKQASVLILSGITRSVQSFLNELDANNYILTIMDAETFGHHRPGLQELLFNLYKEHTDTLKPVLVSDLPEYFPEALEVEPRASTWSNEEQDFWLDKERKVTAKNPFLLWRDPSNPIHKLQWEFTEWIIEKLSKGVILSPAPRGEESRGDEYRQRDPSASPQDDNALVTRQLLDKALSSDMFWWASAKPWWSLEMIEAGARQLAQVVESLCPSAVKKGVMQEQHFQFSIFNFQFSIVRKNYCQKLLEQANNYYRQILNLAFEWQRSGKIRQAHKEAQGEWKDIPFKERAPAEWYNQIILEFEDEMKKAAQNLEFEKAIKWRDAIIKLKSGMDVYDVLHVVDELHSVRRIPSVKPFLEHKSEELSDFAKEHFLPLERGSE